MGRARTGVDSTKRIARERIRALFSQADKESKDHPELSSRYVTLARKISMKVNVSIPRELRRRFCKKCASYLKPGVNLRVRLHRNRVIYTCLKCGNIMRFKKLEKKI